MNTREREKKFKQIRESRPDLRNSAGLRYFCKIEGRSSKRTAQGTHKLGDIAKMAMKKRLIGYL